MNQTVEAAVLSGALENMPPGTHSTGSGQAPAATTQVGLKTRLVHFAHELGFDSCRIARCSPPAHAEEFLDWLDQGAHGEMEYMARGKAKRSDPQNILPGARSIVV